MRKPTKRLRRRLNGIVRRRFVKATIGQQQRHDADVEAQLMRVLANDACCEQIGSDELHEIERMERTGGAK